MEKPLAAKNRIHRSWYRAFVDGVFFRNPVLAGGLGLYLVLAGSRSLASAGVLSVLTFARMVPICWLGSIVGRRVAAWLRLPLAFLCTAALYLPLSLLAAWLFPQVVQDWGLCGVLAAANSMILRRASRNAPEKAPMAALADGAGSALGFAAVLLLVSAVWEVLAQLEASGGGAFSQAPVMVGLLVVAFLAALRQYAWNSARRQRQSRQEKERRELL